jgi:signal transduction histidine kinase
MFGRQSWTATRPGPANLGPLLGLGDDSDIDDTAICKALKTVGDNDLAATISALRAEGTAFSIAAEPADEDKDGRYVVSGRRLAISGERTVDVLQIRDIGNEYIRRTQAEAARDLLRATLNVLPMPVWCRDRDLAIIDCNDSYVAAVEAEGVDQVVAEGREMAAAAIADGGKALAREARDMGTVLSQRCHVVIDGSRRLLEVSEQALPGTAMLLGFAIDRTDEEDSEGELKRHIDAHGEVLQNLATAIAIYGPDKRLKFFNSAFVNLWELDGEFLYAEPTLGEVLEALRVGRRLPEFADFPAWKKDQEGQIMNLIDPVEDLMHLPDGRTLRTFTTPHPFGGLLLLYEDVTDRLALERSYNTLIAVQRETLDNLDEGVAVVGGDGRLKLFNSSFARMWDCPEDELKGEPHVSDLVERAKHFYASQNWDAFKERMVAKLTGRTGHAGQIERTDGRVLKFALVPLPDGGMLLSYSDMTDSHRVQHALREQAEALETADRLKTEFLTNVSYELRTPLNTILGFTEILDKGFYGGLNDRQREYIEGILTSSRGLLSLIDNILDLAMIEAGRLTLERGEVDIGAMLDSISGLGAHWARQREIDLSFERDGDLGVIVADERRLKQALMNLVSNAIAYTAPGGRITVSARQVKGEAAISVTDTGVGIDAEDHDRVFEKFERGTASGGRAAGVGLGLSLVKQIVELHGGRVELDSAPDKGTTVTCVVPESAPPPPQDDGE